MEKTCGNIKFRLMGLTLSLIFLFSALVPMVTAYHFSTSDNIEKMESLLAKILKNIDGKSFSKSDNSDNCDENSDTELDQDFFIANFPLAIQLPILSSSKKEISDLKNTLLTDIQTDITLPPPKF